MQSMLEFELGIIIGIMLCGFIYATEFVLFRRHTTLTKKMDRKLIKDLLPHIPKAKGFVIMPESDEQIARQELMDRNDREGKPTKLEDL